MATLTVRARFPLGVYHGHRSDGRTADRLPDTARLLSALVHSAGKGSLAVLEDGELRPSAASMRALRWIEDHAPTRIDVPEFCAASGDVNYIAFREEGVFERRQGHGVVSVKHEKAATDGFAVAGAVGWEWDDAPEDVIDTVSALCSDVSCLGEASSPAVLTVGAALEAPWTLDRSAGWFSRGGLAVRTPTAGRLDILEAAHGRLRPAKLPTATQDRHSFSRDPGAEPTGDDGTVVLRYRAPMAAPGRSPWRRVLAFSIRSGRIRSEDRVSWCVVFHRALVRGLADDAPSLLTGRYLPEAPRPANRIALQYLEPSLVSRSSLVGDFPRGALLLLLPEMSAAEEEALRQGLGFVHRLYRSRDSDPLEIEQSVEVNADRFWEPTPCDMRRLWVPMPALVPETRRQPAKDGRHWGLSEAARLSYAFVFRDQLADVDGGAGRYWALAEEAERRGVRVGRPALIGDSKIERYAYKLPTGVVAQPYTAILDLGAQAHDEWLLAIGQSRHVGGGLLTPLDVPTDMVEVMMR